VLRYDIEDAWRLQQGTLGCVKDGDKLFADVRKDGVFMFGERSLLALNLDLQEAGVKMRWHSCLLPPSCFGALGAINCCKQPLVYA